ncbi:ABC transporter permease [Patulibacter sp.]|uniref:MlaE family ABC transporter permease n=1 Tax=Patulibacter sp. TaxID=1912859 RepID=UPI0027210CD9|nr:ABC transporter permease [Patulibacter sp.]MDO9409647.1 ABC transporter permease [Patulibacter sp.]
MPATAPPPELAPYAPGPAVATEPPAARPGGRLRAAVGERLRRWGGMVALLGAVAAALVRPPFAWRREFVIACVELLRSSFWPIAISVAVFGFSGPGLQAGNFLEAFGSTDRSGGFMVVAIVREFGTFVTAAVVAGIVGTMLAAELGTRRVRGEIDALETLGVDPVAGIVAPRTLALVVMLMLLDVFALVFGVAGGYVASVGVLDGTTGAFVSSFMSNVTFLDLLGSVGKVGIFGLLIGIICSWHGLHAEGGAHGVGRAVNRAVVGSLMAIFVVNLVYTQWFLATFPEVNVLR